MMRRRGRGAIRLFASVAVLTMTGVGCSLLVSGDVPEFQCLGSDPSACPSGMVCDGVKHRCISGEAGVVPVEAGDEEIPDGQVAEAGMDADAGGPADLGGKCRLDTDCKSRLCGSSAALTPAITQSTGPICTTPCCTSVECPASFVCFNGGTGGGYCVPATLAQRAPPTSGGKAAGASCVAHSDCRSGLCTKPDAGTLRCVDTCCTQSECGAGTTCRLNPAYVPGGTHWVCAPPEPGATGQPGDPCVNTTDCATDTCIGFGPSRICRPPCSNTASCKSVPGFASGHCLYGPSGSDFFKFCFSTSPTSGRSVAGVVCSDDGTCQSDYCDPELGVCANVCARDSDCTAAQTCRPSAKGTPFLRCVARP